MNNTTPQTGFGFTEPPAEKPEEKPEPDNVVPFGPIQPKRLTDLRPGDIVFVKRKEVHKSHVKSVFLELVGQQYIAVFLLSGLKRVEVPILWLKGIQTSFDEIVYFPPSDES